MLTTSPGIARLVLPITTEHELFEKPAGVREMPFAGAGIGHRLHQQIFGAQAIAQRDRALAHLAETQRDAG